MPAPRRELRDLGWLDADLFVHPFFDNPESATCRRVLDAIQAGAATGSLDDVTVHEILYVLWRHLTPKYPDESARRRFIARYVSGFVVLPHLDVREREVTLEALHLWGSEQARSYGDARILVRAKTEGRPVCSSNGRDFPGVPNTYGSA